MNRLWIQLTLGFALVVLVSMLVLALLTNVRATTTFRGYLAQTQAVESGLIERLGRPESEALAGCLGLGPAALPQWGARRAGGAQGQASR